MTNMILGCAYFRVLRAYFSITFSTNPLKSILVSCFLALMRVEGILATHLSLMAITLEEAVVVLGLNTGDCCWLVFLLMISMSRN